MERFVICRGNQYCINCQQRKLFSLDCIQDMTFNASRVLIVPFLMLIFTINYYPYHISFIIAALFTLLYPLLNKAGMMI